MKKFISLALALLLCLCALTPIVAEEAPAAALPDLNLPVSLADYQKAYEAVVTLNAPTCTVTWSAHELDEGTVWMAVINDSFTSLMLLMEGENVAEVACLMQSELTEDALWTFLSMAGYGGAALMVDEDTEAAAATEAFMPELFTVFSSMVQGDTTPKNICGLPGGMSISMVSESTYQFYFVLNLTGIAANEAAAE